MLFAVPDVDVPAGHARICNGNFTDRLAVFTADENPAYLFFNFRLYRFFRHISYETGFIHLN